MDVAIDMYIVTSTIIFTLFAIILASVFLKMKSAPAEKEPCKPEDEADGAQSDKANAEGDPGDGERSETDEKEPATVSREEDVKDEEAKGDAAKTEQPAEPREKAETVAGGAKGVEEIGAEDGEVNKEHTRQEAEKASVREDTVLDESIAKTESQVPHHEADKEESQNTAPAHEKGTAVAEEAEEVQLSLKYSPGKLRASQYENMMTKEELEEEQRVQREQLAAIFRLLKENKDTFGEMTEGDVEEQLKLYSI
nr:PREDICTED: matrix-remodeling-associated protein 7 isoform X1 [Lepisosteus oculatus]